MERLRPLSNLLAVILVCAAPVSSFALVMRDSGPEPVIVQIKDSLRTSDDLDERLAGLLTLGRQNHLKLEQWWAGSKLLALISFPSTFSEQRALDVVAQLQQSAAVEKVVALSAQNLEFKPVDFERAYRPDQTMPDAARRGFDKDRIHGRSQPTYDSASLSRIAHAPNRLIVKWKEENVWKADQAGFTRRMAEFHAAAGCRVVREDRKSSTDLTHVLEFDNPDTLPTKLNQYANSGLVVYAQPDFVYELTAVPSAAPNDPVYASSPGPQWALPQIEAPQAWAVPCPNPAGSGPDVPCTGNHSVIIAVCDGGAPVNGPPRFASPSPSPHPDFKDNIWDGQNKVYSTSAENSANIHNWYGRNFDVTDDRGHGTHVASIIGARGNNGSYMTGVAWDTSLMILKVTNSGHARGTTDQQVTLALSSDVSSAIAYAAKNGATAINISLQHRYYDTVADGEPLYETDPNMLQALRDARSKGMLVVTAAGNGNEQVNRELSPAGIPTDNMIVVGATTKNDTRATYSNYGRHQVDLGAPGGERNPNDVNDNSGAILGLAALSTGCFQFGCISPNFYDASHRYLYMSGTSMATPHVSGAVALLKSKYPWENYTGIRDRILMATDHISSLAPYWRTGGRLNLYKALQPRNLILNLSTRARVEGGDKVMIAGFVIGGSKDGGPLRVAIRGLGPSLPVNVARLGNPVVELHRSDGSIVVTNDDWQQDSSSGEVSSLGLQPSDTREAALVKALSPGAYTVVLRDRGAQYGVGIVEIYNLDGNANEKSRLLNLSTRCLVGTGDNTASAGLIVRGPTDPNLPDDRPSVADRRVLVFGKIPMLDATHQVPGALQDPDIELHDADSILSRNSDYGLVEDNSQMQAVLENNSLTEAGFKPVNASEAGLWPFLRPGAYTTVLTGKNNSTGVGLVEFYEY